MGTSQGITGKETSSEKRARPVSGCKLGAFWTPLSLKPAELEWKSCEMRKEALRWRLPGNFNSVLDELPALCFCCRAQPANDKTSAGPPPAHGILLSICPPQGLAHSLVPGVPCKAMGPHGSITEGQSRNKLLFPERFAGAGFDPWDWVGAAARIFLNQPGFLSTTARKKNAN